MMKYALMSLMLRVSIEDLVSHVCCLVFASKAIWKMLCEGATRPRFVGVSDMLSWIVNATNRGCTKHCNSLHLHKNCIRLVHVLGRLMTTEDERSPVRRHVDALVHTGYRTATNGDSFLHVA